MKHLIRLGALLTLLTATLPASMLYVVDYAGGSGSNFPGSVFRVTATGTVSEFIADLNNPRAIAAQGATLLVNDGAEIWRYDETTGARIGLTPFATLPGVDSIVVDLMGNVFASSSADGVIKKYNASGIEVASALAAEPSALSLDDQGNLLVLVAPGGAFEWQRFSVADLTFVDTLTASGLNTSYGSTYQGGTLYYSDFFGDVMQVNSAGVVTPFASSGLIFNWGLAFDPNGELFVANNGSGTIERFSATGVHQGTFASGFVSPAGLAFTPVPEPGTLLLAGGALIFVGTRRRREA